MTLLEGQYVPLAQGNLLFKDGNLEIVSPDQHVLASVLPVNGSAYCPAGTFCKAVFDMTGNLDLLSNDTPYWSTSLTQPQNATPYFQFFTGTLVPSAQIISVSGKNPTTLWLLAGVPQLRGEVTELVSSTNGLCAQSQGMLNKLQNPIVQVTCNNAIETQSFKMGTSNAGIGLYNIYVQGTRGKCLSSQQGLAQDITLGACDSASSSWQVIVNVDGSFSFETVDGTGCLAFPPDANIGDPFTLQSCTGKGAPFEALAPGLH